jgi:hypothetical protein
MVKKRLAAVIFSSLLAVTGWAATPNPSVIATPPQPNWMSLTVDQKVVLAPLAGDWDAMEHYRRKKWIGIAVRFPTMSAEEQRRVQGQMQEWGKLTPEQRRLAREKFQVMNQLPAEKKQELKQKWEEYSSLPEEEKEKHKLQGQQNASKPVPKPGRPLTTAPAPAASTANTVQSITPAETPPAATSDNASLPVDKTPRP